jgi:hypothetical protein
MSTPFDEEAMLAKAKKRTHNDLARIRQLLETYHKDVEPDDASTTEWALALLLHLHPQEKQNQYRRLVSDSIIALRSAGLSEQADAVARLYHEKTQPPLPAPPYPYSWKFPAGSHVRAKQGYAYPMIVRKHLSTADGPIYEFIKDGILYIYSADYAEKMFERVI